MFTDLRWLLTAALMTSSLAVAQEALPPEAQAARDRLVLQANQAVSEILRLHCPDRCQVLDVRAEVDVGAPLAHVQPGFEELSPAVREVRVRGVEVQLLIDARLPAEFRRDFVGLVKARLKALPVTTSVRAETVPFPQPVLAPVPPGLSPPAPAPPPPEPDEEEPPAPAPAPFDPSQAFLERLIEASPWLLAIILVALALLALVRMLRPPEAYEEEPAPAPVVAAQPQPGPPVDVVARRLRAELDDNPRLGASVLKQLLLSGADDRVAATVRLLGPTAFEPLREDPACRDALSRVGHSLRAGAPMPSDDEARELLATLEGSLLAARLSGAGASAQESFAFLDRLSLSAFRRLLETASPRAQGVALRFAPAHLRDGALEALDPAARRRLFLGAAEAGVIDGPELADLADELRLKASRAAPGGDDAGLTLLTELLDSQGEAEQVALLDALASKPAVRQALLDRQVSETTLTRADDDVLVALAAEVELEALAGFLRGSARELQTRFTNALSGRLASALREELSLAVPFVQTQFAQDRRRVLSAARRVLEARGVSIAELNAGTSARATG